MKDERSLAAALAAPQALFPPEGRARPASAFRVRARPPVRTVAPHAPLRSEDDRAAAERRRLLARLIDAESRSAVTRCADEIQRAGFSFPDDQDVQVALLQHAREDHVRMALEALARILGAEPPRRRTVLKARLRWLEEAAEDASTRSMAGALRRMALARA